MAQLLYAFLGSVAPKELIILLKKTNLCPLLSILECHWIQKSNVTVIKVQDCSLYIIQLVFMSHGNICISHDFSTQSVVESVKVVLECSIQHVIILFHIFFYKVNVISCRYKLKTKPHIIQCVIDGGKHSYNFYKWTGSPTVPPGR